MTVKQNLKERSLNYKIQGANFVTRALLNFSSKKDLLDKVEGVENIIKEHDIGSLGGALALGGINFVSDLIDKPNNWVNRNTNLLAGIYYGCQSILDLYQIGKGDFTQLIDLATHGSMAYTGIKDAAKGYNAKNTNPLKDFGLKK
ncbi:MAG: hypothetical protein U9Q99_03230 [Nanoarchaeota archaeon]|nr:hypothetical protein [Nanoarchaeota archaeon]